MTSAGRGCTAWAVTARAVPRPGLYPAGWRCDEHARRADGRRQPRRSEDTHAASRAERRCARMARFPAPPRHQATRPARPRRNSTATGTDPRCRDGHTGWEPRATTDPGRIRRGWTGAPFNIGIACGPVPPGRRRPRHAQARRHPAAGMGPARHPHRGRRARGALRRGPGNPTRPTPGPCRTPSGGTHLYFTAPADGPELRNTQGAAGGLGWLVDTRAGGRVRRRRPEAPSTAAPTRSPATRPGPAARVASRAATARPAAPAAARRRVPARRAGRWLPPRGRRRRASPRARLPAARAQHRALPGRGRARAARRRGRAQRSRRNRVAHRRGRAGRAAARRDGPHHRIRPEGRCARPRSVAA